MHQSFNFKDVLSFSARAPGQIEDVLPQGAVLDFAGGPASKTRARTGAIRFPERRERRILAQMNWQNRTAAATPSAAIALPSR